MSAATLKKLDSSAAYPAAARFFEQLSALFATAPAEKARPIAQNKLKAPLNALKNVPGPELARVRAVLTQMSTQIDQILESEVLGEDWKAAAKEDVHVKGILAKARARVGPAPAATAELASTDFMDEMRQGSANALQRRIANKELLPPKEFQIAVNVRRQSISDAVKSGRMFALVGPSGENYYPAFYADAELDRRMVEKVAKVLGQLPSTSKYFFFTSNSVRLGGDTPLAALKKGRLADVLVAAAGFAVR